MSTSFKKRGLRNVLELQRDQSNGFAWIDRLHIWLAPQLIVQLYVLQQLECGLIFADKPALSEHYYNISPTLHKPRQLVAQCS